MQTKREQQDNRGGFRAKAGRPKETLSYNQVREALDKAAEYVEMTGKTIDEILLDFIYDLVPNEEVVTRDRLAAMKLWKDCTRVKISEGSEADKELGPEFYLPERRPDPAKIVPIKEAS